MAQKFSLAAQLNLLPPNNVRAVVQNINNQLRGINSNLNINANIPTGFTKQLGTISKTARAVKKDLGDAGDEMERFGDAAALALRRFTAFAISTKIVFGFTDAIKNGIKAASQFETELVKVRSASGNSARDLKGLTDEVSRLSKLYGVSSLELIKVSRILVQAGLNAQDTKKSLDALAKTDLVGTFGSLEDAGDGVIAFMTQFGVKAGELEKRLSQINAVAKQTAVEAEDIVVAFKKAGGSFKAAGGSFEELIALLTSVRATTRESADSIATGFRTIFGRIQRPKTIAFLRDMNIELEKSGKFVGPYAAIQKLGEALEKLDSTDLRFASIVEELGGIRQLSKVIPLIQQTALQQKALNIALISTADLSEDAARAQGTLARESAKVAENFSQFVRDIYNGSPFQTLAKDAIKLADILISVGEALKPIQSFIGTGISFAGAASIFKIGQGFTKRITGQRNLTGNSLFLSSGGPIRHGSGVKDDVPAVLKRGEYVISQKGVQSVGTNYLNDLNAGKVKKFTQGGPTDDLYAQRAILSKQYNEIQNRQIDPRYKKFQTTIQEHELKILENKIKEIDNKLLDYSFTYIPSSKSRKTPNQPNQTGNLHVGNLTKPNKPTPEPVVPVQKQQATLTLAQLKEIARIAENSNRTPEQQKLIKQQTKQEVEKLINAVVFPKQPTPTEAIDLGKVDLSKGKGKVPKPTPNTTISTTPSINVGDLETPDKVKKPVSEKTQLKRDAEALRIQAEERRVAARKKDYDFNTIPFGDTIKTGASLTGRRAGILSRLSPELQGIALSEFNQQKQTAFLPSEEQKPFKLTKKLEAQAEQLLVQTLLPSIQQKTKLSNASLNVPASLVDKKIPELDIKEISPVDPLFSQVKNKREFGIQGLPFRTILGRKKEQSLGFANISDDKRLANTMNIIKELPNEIQNMIQRVSVRDLSHLGNPRGRANSAGEIILNSKQFPSRDTVKHEAGHVVDFNLGKTGKFTKGLASETKGTFQNVIANKLLNQRNEEIQKMIVSGDLNKLARNMGKTSTEVLHYLTSKREIFADFFAAQNKEVQTILASTTDAKKGFARLNTLSTRIPELLGKHDPTRIPSVFNPERNKQNVNLQRLELLETAKFKKQGLSLEEAKLRTQFTVGKEYAKLAEESQKQSKLSTKVTQKFRNFFGGPSGPSGPVAPGGVPTTQKRNRLGGALSTVASGLTPNRLSLIGLGAGVLSQTRLIGTDRNNETTRQIQDFTSNLAASSLVLSILPSTLTKSVDKVRDSLSRQTDKLNTNKNKLSDVERQILVSRLRGTTGTNKFQNLLAEQSILTNSITSQERGLGKTKSIEAKLARKQRLNSIVGFAGGIALSAASATSGSFERQGEQQLESGNTQGFSRSRGISGALSGGATVAGIGLSLGLMTGNPVLAAFGAAVGAVGGALYGFKKSIEEAADQIRSTEFNKSFDTFVRRLDQSFKAGLPGQQVLSVKSELERAKSSFLTGSPDTRETIRGRIKGESSKILDVLTAFAGTGGGKNANIQNVIKNLSFFTDIPVEELSKRFDESALAMSKHINISNKLNAYLERSVTEFIKLNQVIQSFESASSSVIDNRARTNTLGEFASGGIGRTTSPFGSIGRSGGIFLDSGRLNREAGKTAGLFGNSSPAIFKSFTEASVAMNRLPDALLQILGQDRLGGDNFQSAFKDFGPIGGKIVEILRQDIIGNTEDPNKLRDELKTNFAGVLSKVGEKIFDPIANIFNSANSQISSEVDAYIKGVGEIRQNQARIVGIFDNILSLTEQTERVRASLEDRKVNTGLLGRIESARGKNVLGGLTGTPDALADRNLLARTRILDLETKLREGSVKATKEVISALEGERTVLEKTTAGLRYLGDVSGRIGALQERLGQVRGKRELATDIAGEFAFGDRGSRKALIETLTIIRGLAFSSSKGRRISTDLIPEKSRGDVDALLSKIGDETFGGLFGKTGKGLREELIKSSVGPSGLKEITKSAEEKSLEKQITDAFDIGVKAMEKLATIEETANKKYISELSSTFDKFIANLNESLSRSEIANLERDVAAATSKNFEAKSAVDRRYSVPFAPDIVTELAKLTKQGTLGQLVTNVSAISGQQKQNAILNNFPKLSNLKSTSSLFTTASELGIAGGDTSHIKNIDSFQKDIFNKLRGFGINESISSRVSGNITKSATAKQSEVDAFGSKKGITPEQLDVIITEQLATESKNLSTSIKDTQQQFSDITSTLGLTNTELNNIIKNFGTIGKTLNEIDPSISLRTLQEQSLAAGYALQQLTAQLYGLKSGTPVAKAAGGHIPGVGNRDTVPAKLTPGEFVVKKSSANSIGRDTLDHMNMYGEIPFAVGGRVERMQKRQAYLAARSARRSAFTGAREQNRASYLDSKYIAPDVNPMHFNIFENPIIALKRLKNYKPSKERTKIDEYFRGKIRERIGTPKSKSTFSTPPVSVPVATKPVVPEYDPTAWRKDIVYPEVKRKDFSPVWDGSTFSTPHTEYAKSYYDLPDTASGALTDLMERRTLAGKSNYGESFPQFFQNYKGQINKPYNPHLTTRINQNDITNRILQEQKQRRGFALGGPVPGVGNKDTIPANLMPGEYVLRKQAAQAIGTPKLDQMNRQGFANGGAVDNNPNSFRPLYSLRHSGTNATETRQTAPANMSGFNDSITQLNSTFGKFATNSERLAQALDSFPREISLSGHHTVEVIINGAQVMTNIMPEVSKLIESQTKSALNNMLAKKFPEVGQM